MLKTMLLADDKDSTIKLFFSRFKKFQYKKSETVLRPDSTPLGVYFLEKGYVRAYIKNDQDHEFTVHIFQPGSFFPMTWAMANLPNSFYFEAITEATINLTPLKKFLARLKEDQSFMSAINKVVLINLNLLLMRMQYVVTGSATQRVANVLILLGNRLGKKNPKSAVTFSATQQLIASLTALTRESVGLELKKFASEGLITCKYRQCKIINPNLLQKKYCVNSGLESAQLA